MLMLHCSICLCIFTLQFSTHFNQIEVLGHILKEPRKLNVLSEKVIDLRMLLLS